MLFEEVLRRRRMVRNYLPDPVAEEVLTRVVEAARKAPSAGFSQGTAFVVVTDPETRKRIAELAGESSYVAAGFDPWISRAPAHIVICVSEDVYHRRYQEPDKTDADGMETDWPIPYWWVDAGAAMMLVLLAAVNEGLAAGFLGVHSLPGLSNLLSIPSQFTPIGVVTVGRGAPDRRSGSLRRGWRPTAAVIHWESWGGLSPR
ncbi:MAG TPA: nitroreductase family protein [Acidimicrobiia bacterium]|nr:nitroreductase family protein [Acidimicrobiia bacterium]